MKGIFVRNNGRNVQLSRISGLGVVLCVILPFSFHCLVHVFFFERGRGAFDSFRLYTHVNKVGECRWNSEHWPLQGSIEVTIYNHSVSLNYNIQFNTCCILYPSTLDILSVEAVEIFFKMITSRGAPMRIKCFPFENSSCMRIKKISLMSSRTISGVQEEF